MKLILLFSVLVMSSLASAESLCDIRLGSSVGVKVVEFTSGNIIHSKMALKELSQVALSEEMVNLQDLGLCEERILAKKCILRFEKTPKERLITLFRGQDRWLSWATRSKVEAQEFVKKLQKAGFCS